MDDHARKASALAIKAQQAFCASCDLSVEALDVAVPMTPAQRAQRREDLRLAIQQRTQAYRDLNHMRMRHNKNFPPQPSWASRLIARFARRRARGAA